MTTEELQRAKLLIDYVRMAVENIEVQGIVEQPYLYFTTAANVKAIMDYTRELNTLMGNVLQAK